VFTCLRTVGRRYHGQPAGVGIDEAPHRGVDVGVQGQLGAQV